MYYGGRHQKGNTKYELLSSKKCDLYGLGPVRATMGPKDHQDCAFKLSKSSLSLFKKLKNIKRGVGMMWVKAVRNNMISKDSKNNTNFNTSSN